jgi:uncharacterized membrane protein HdeD (DUF308 family)
MFEFMTRNWWTVALRGLCALLFGVATIAWPDMTLATLTLLFGIFAIADGILALVALFDRASRKRRWAQALHGVLSLLAGGLALAQPETIALAFVYVIAVWAFLTGCLTIVAAIQLRKVIADEWLLGLSGAGALLFSVSLAVYPEAGMLVLLTLIGAYAIIVGILHIALGLRLRHLHTATQQTVAGTQSTTL